MTTKGVMLRVGAAAMLAGTLSANLCAQSYDPMPCPFGSPARSALAVRHGLEPGTVFGRVVELDSGRPPQQALVQLRLTSDIVGLDSIVDRDKRRPSTFYTYRGVAKLRALSDSLGQFRMNAVPSGQYRITVSSMGAVVQDTATVGGAGLRLFAVLAPWDGDIECVQILTPRPPN